MTKPNISIKLERPQDAAIIEHLNAVAFGPGRFALTAYRVREQAQLVDELCFTAWINGICAGSIRHSLVSCGGHSGLMLGPLVVHPDYKSVGCGQSLIVHSLGEAAQLNHLWVILVGDKPYYSRSGFDSVPAGQITLPGPVDPARILVKEFQPGILQTLNGIIHPVLNEQFLSPFAEPTRCK